MPLDQVFTQPTSILRDDDVTWLTMHSRAADTFAGIAAPTGVTPDQDPLFWLRRGVQALERTNPALTRSLREAVAPVIVIRGMPVGPAAPTPYDGVVDLAASRRTIFNLHAVLGCLGLFPIAYAGENASVSHAVCPVTAARGQASSRGFDADLPFHTDYADRPITEPVVDRSPAASVLAFGIERADPSVPMQYMPVRRLLSRLTARQIRIGRAEEFVVETPAIFGMGHRPALRRLFAPDGSCRLNLGRMTGATPRAARLLHEIRDILSAESLVETLHVRRGDVVIMDNQRAIHRRASFTPRWDGTDRYFIRVSATRDPFAGIAADSRRPWIWS